MFGSSLLNREWELVTVSEMCRRLDLDELDKEDEMPIPQGASQSMILDEIMIRQARLLISLMVVYNLENPSTYSLAFLFKLKMSLANEGWTSSMKCKIKDVEEG